MMVVQLLEVLEERQTPLGSCLQLPNRKPLGRGHASLHFLDALGVTLQPLLGRSVKENRGVSLHWC